MLIKLTEGRSREYTFGQLKRDNPNVSFPSDISEEILAEYGVYKVAMVPAPDADSKTHRVVSRFELVGEVWTQAWSIEELPIDSAEANVRAVRNSLLNKTDWIVLRSQEQGGSIPDEWQNYRQALRDISLQPDFPYSVNWPLDSEHEE